MRVSVAIPWVLNPMPAATSHPAGMNTHPVTMPVTFSLETLFTALALSVVIGAVTCTAAARRPANMEVMDALRDV
jgi:ABC-type lipoprotein release transport system permease subunit